MNQPLLPRRDFLRIGTMGGLSLAQTLRWQEACVAGGARRDVNCIFLFLTGGMPHLDLWDLKPDAPAEVRGEFSPIDTVVPGIQISDIMPRTARVTDRIAILRGMTHDESDHGCGFDLMMTGKRPGTGDVNGRWDNNRPPRLGSIVAKLGDHRGVLPSYIAVPDLSHSDGMEFRSPSYGPFVLEADSVEPIFAVSDVTLPPSIAIGHCARQLGSLRAIHWFEERVEQVAQTIPSLDTSYERACRLMTSNAAKAAFDINCERESTRREYGMTRLGHSCLLARRLVEAGCRFVSIESGPWDTHSRNAYCLKEMLVPDFDQAFPALLNDLFQRGLLDSTLVVVATEFGRTPRTNGRAGRDHWPNAFSIVMAGAGIKAGQVVGATDERAAFVTDRPITPEEFAATILRLFGIDSATPPDARPGRPLLLIDGGKPVSEALA